MTNSKDFPRFDVRHHFRVLLATDRLQERATVYSVARELSCTRSMVQTALRVAADQFGVVFERTDAIRIIDWGVLDKSALAAFIGPAENKTSVSVMPPVEADNPTQGIRRVDDDISLTYGWYVYLKRVSGKFDRFFGDRACGGKVAALDAARTWHNKKIAECPLMPRVERMSITRKNNQSGMAGVYRWPADGRTPQNAYWAAKWIETVGSKPVIKKFTVKRYGEQTAKDLATAARENAMACLID